MPSPTRSISEPSKVLVFGAGNFGSCLADHLGDSDHDVYLWSRQGEVVESLNKTHRNPMYLKDHHFSTNITAVGPELPGETLINEMDVLLFAIPTQFLRENLEKLRLYLNKEKHPLLIFVNKGIEIGTHALTLEIITDTCGAGIAKAATFISGPSFAKESKICNLTCLLVVQRQPTSVSVTSFTDSEAQRAAILFHQPHFRCYTGSDPIGTELAGALKNVYAIAAGAADGLGFENNTRAMIITRGLAEMTRIGTAYGADPLTFLGLAGVGDLFMSCSSPTSRNYSVGFRLGKGESLDSIINNLGSVAEGVTTAKGVKMILDELGIKARIATTVIYEETIIPGKDIQAAVRELLELPSSKEIDLPSATGGPAKQLMKKLGLD
ncbi:6-phosphogluconate dehydrogenase [Lentinula boryana]|uniref:Glycerol-3-phosphate dehydrogenase [NAD(+)] n=1 Tax=Lentinula boryana TaxID=40481 RepID=A0ABQ8QJJ8_9AGAR|nr:6-phosphogluconate dehydrogenase [Lentinula boryana]